MLIITIGKNKRTGHAEELRWEVVGIDELAALASTDALFGGTRTFLFAGALAGERAEEFLDLAEAFVKSPHTFLFEEEKLLKRETDIVTKAGGSVEKIEAIKKERGFDPFGLTFALAARDKKKLWLGLVQAFRTGEKAEPVAGLLHWKIRDMLGSGRSDKYSLADLKKLSRELVFLYHDSHRGAGDLELLLERFALKL